MADTRRPTVIDPHLVAEIVRSYVGHNSIATDQIGALIVAVHQALSTLGTTAPAPLPASLMPAVPVRQSVRPDYVVCLECGFRGLMLRRHLRDAHNLQPAGYRARWKLAPDHPLTAPNYSAQRSAMAKQLGFGRRRRGTSPTSKRANSDPGSR